MSPSEDEKREPQDELEFDQPDAGPSEPRETSDAESADAEELDLSTSEGVDDAAAAAGSVDETVEFEQPAAGESDIAFQPMGDLGAETQEESEDLGAEALAAFAPEGSDSIDDPGEDEGGEGEEEAEEEKEEKPKRNILAAIANSNPYSVLLGVALLALIIGALCFYFELAAYDFDIGAEKAKQLVGSLGFGS